MPDVPSITLGKFLNKFEEELVPNIFKITVSGDLSFEQDLVYSKLLSHDSLKATIEAHKKEFDEGFDDSAHINANFVLLRKEIRNGVITSDILETIKKVATSQELKEFMNLEVVTACFWIKSDYVETPDEWIIVLNHFKEFYKSGFFSLDTPTVTCLNRVQASLTLWSSQMPSLKDCTNSV